MKILFIITGFGLSRTIGGAGLRTIEIAKLYSQWGHDIHFFTTKAGKKFISQFNFNCSFHLVKASHFRKEEKTRIDRLLSYIVSTFDSYNKIKNLPEFEVIISTDDYFTHTIPAFLYKLKNRNTKWVAYAHEPPNYIWPLRFLKAKISGHKIPFKDICIHLLYYPFQEFSFILFRINCDKILTIGTEGKLIKDHLWISEKRIGSIENGVDLTFIKSIPDKNKIYDACFLGGYRPSKGIFDLIPIWRNVVITKKDARLLVIGSGSKNVENCLKKEIRKYELENNIELAGFISDREEIFELLKSSRIFIFPSHKEGWAIPITEAMACKLPVIVWDYSFYKSIYPRGITYVKLGDFDSFSDQVIDILSNDEKYEKLSEEANILSLNYGWYEVAKREMVILNDLHSKNK